MTRNGKVKASKAVEPAPRKTRAPKGRPVKRRCLKCGKWFTTTPGVIAQGRGKFDSTECRDAYRRTGRQTQRHSVMLTHQHIERVKNLGPINNREGEPGVLSSTVRLSLDILAYLVAPHMGEMDDELHADQIMINLDTLIPGFDVESFSNALEALALQADKWESIAEAGESEV